MMVVVVMMVMIFVIIRYLSPIWLFGPAAVVLVTAG